MRAHVFGAVLGLAFIPFPPINNYAPCQPDDTACVELRQQKPKLLTKNVSVRPNCQGEGCIRIKRKTRLPFKPIHQDAGWC